MNIFGIMYPITELQNSQLIKDMRSKKIHLCKKIMTEVYCYVDANPRHATLRLYLQYNYPTYDNDTDCQLIWDLSIASPEYVSSIVFNV